MASEEIGRDFLKAATSAEDLESATDVLSSISSHLTEEEKADFGLQLLDAIRDENDEQVKSVLEGWSMSVLVRTHPDSARQRKEYDNLQRSGELWEGVDFDSLVR